MQVKMKSWSKEHVRAQQHCIYIKNAAFQSKLRIELLTTYSSMKSDSTSASISVEMINFAFFRLILRSISSMVGRLLSQRWLKVSCWLQSRLSRAEDTFHPHPPQIWHGDWGLTPSHLIPLLWSLAISNTIDSKSTHALVLCIQCIAFLRNKPCFTKSPLRIKQYF